MFANYNEDNNIWNAVWEYDSYADKNLRIEKAKSKVDVLLKYVKPEKDWYVVDLGCGGGYVSEELFLRTGCKITGVDFSKEAIHSAKERLAEKPITFIQGNVCKTNIPNSSADLVICCGIIEHISDKSLIANEVVRVLKPGGIVFITSSNKLSFIWPQRLIKQLFKKWRYGYQENWAPKRLIMFLRSYNIEIVHNQIIITIGDFAWLGLLDRFISLFLKKWGRYIVLIGRKR